MSNLPRSWARVPISEILELNNNGKPFQQGWSPQCHPHPANEAHWGVLKTTAIQPGEFRPHENKELPDHLEGRPNVEVKPGDVLMTCAGPRSRCGVACLVTDTRTKLMMSGKMYRFRPHPKAMTAKFLMYFLRAHATQLEIDRMKTGISDSGLNLTHDRFAALRVPVAPFDEQRRIVARIEELFSELDKGVEALTNTRQQLAVYRKSVLKSAFEGELTATYRSAHADRLQHFSEIVEQMRASRESSYQRTLARWQTLPEESRGQRPRRAVVTELSRDEVDDLPVLPEKWCWSSLSELAEHIVDGTHKTPRYTAEGIAFVSAKDIYGFRIDFANTRFISKGEHQELSKRCHVKRGNVLITKSGTIGRVAVVDTDAEFSLFESVANVPVLDVMNPRFVSLAAYFVIDTSFGRKNQKGVAVRHLHLEDIRRLPVPIMARYEQDEIVLAIESLFSQIDNFELSIDSSLAQSAALRQAILKKAFSGQLVAQDANDEPASKLLERIRAEGGGEASKKRRNNKNGKKEAA